MPPWTPKTIRAKLILVVVFILAGFGAAVAAIGASVHERYKELEIARCRSLVAFQTGRLETAIAALQDNVRQLALAGEILYRTGVAAAVSLPPPASSPGRYAVSRNFSINTLAVGGGIWFKPGAADPRRELVCYYAFSKNGEVVFDESFESREYHYPTQRWYTSISKQLAVSGGIQGRGTAWTPPYIDDTGTRALMTTVGAGMYDGDGAFVGMATVDWRLDDIAGHIAAVKPTPGSFALFADSGHDFILALNDPELAGNPEGKSLALADWFSPYAPAERKVYRYGRTYLSFSKTMDNGMTVAVNVPEDELFGAINATMRSIVSALAAAVLLVVFMTALLLNRLVSRPVSHLSRSAAAIGGGDLDTRIELRSNDELGALADAFNTMTGNLKGYVASLNAVTAERERFATELNIARDIQASMLPSIFPPFPDRPEVDVYARMLPAKQVGGDFFDFFLIDADHLAVVVADVSDKGVPAALFMVIAKTLIRNNAQPGLPPGAILAAANGQLCENNGTGMFVTAFIGVLDLRTGLFAYANAGHNPPYLRRRSGAFERLPLPRGLVLAAMEGAVYATAETGLGPGDALFLYTDGVTEAESADGAFFGEIRLRDTLDAFADPIPGGLRAFLAGIQDELDAFAGGAEQHDDITMLALVFSGTGATGSESGGANTAACASQAPTQAHERLFRAETTAVPELLAFVEETLERAGCPQKRLMRFILAAEEMFVNIASYAYADAADGDASSNEAPGDGEAMEHEASGGVPGHGQVAASLRLFDGPARAELRLTDRGGPFNPLERPAPDLTLPPEEREIGGLGVFLAGKNTDAMAYERRGGCNVLTLMLFFD